MPNTLADVIRLARKIHKDHPELLAHGLPVPVVPNLRQIAESSALIRLKTRAIEAGTAHPEKYEIKIAETLAPSEGYLRSLLATYENARPPHSRVLLTTDNNRCWRRFCVTKEVMHVLTGFVGNPQNVSGQISLARKSRFTTPNEGTPDLDGETFCLYLAIEVLIPWRYRQELSADLHERRLTLLQIAHKYAVPRAIIEEILETDYAESSYKINSGIAL